MKTTTILAMFLCASLGLAAQDISLPKPKTTGGMPLMEALSKRQSSREFSTRDLDNQTLSNLLWAAWGFNRADKRTAPSSQNKQELELYVVIKSGAYLYDAKNNVLKQVAKGDHRKTAGTQEFVATAALNIVFVADKSKNTTLNPSYTNSGFISQNIYLFCASEGLSTVVRGMFKADELGKLLQLPETKTAILTQTVGYPK